MANKFTKYLKQFGGGFESGVTNPKGVVGNWTHATRIFVDDTYRLSPRTKFLFYVYFDINENALKSTSWDKQTHGREVGMLVKRAGLPKFNFDTVTKNQYNRKKLLYKTLEYQPIEIAMHDDSNAIVTSMLALYNGYYVVDRNKQELNYQYNQYDATLDQRFGLDNNVGENNEKRPFFNSIQLFTMSRRRFVGYTLINPRITNYTHGNVDYFESDTVESTMTLEYENVINTSGNITEATPKGFAELHYDTQPSPLTVQGGGVETLLTEGGVLDGMSQVFGDIGSGAAFEDPASFISTVVKGVNTYDNAENLKLENIKYEAAGLLGPALATGTGSAIGAIGGFFSKSAPNETQATQRKMTPPRNNDIL